MHSSGHALTHDDGDVPRDSANTSAVPCRICGNAIGNKDYRIREMLHGTREKFDYFQCSACGCLQIKHIPDDLGRHYPENYFSFRRFDKLARNRLRNYIDQRRVKHSSGQPNPIGWAANRFGRPLDYFGWMQRAGLDTSARVLDVGCGNGKVLLRMKLGGFTDCTGVDPFIKETIHYPNGVTIHKAEFDTFSASAQPFDLIMFHHALEHMLDPLKALRAASRLLTKDGCVLIAVPVADSFAWETYREDWFNLDAPRHLHLLTRKSMEILAEKAGLRVEHAESVGMVSQFSESERYKRDIPGNGPMLASEILGTQQMAEFHRKTEALNREGGGDQTMFWLRPIASAKHG